MFTPGGISGHPEGLKFPIIILGNDAADLARRPLTPGLIFVFAENGRIAAVYLFFDKLP